MNLKDYFENTGGFGVLSTSDSEGKVDSAVYSRPHMMEDGTLALIMRDRLSHKNLQSNPHAAYLFKEDGPGYKGRRFYLTKIREEENAELIQTLRRRSYPEEESNESVFLVIFRLDKELPLIGSGGDRR